MDDKIAAKILINLLNKDSLGAEEKEAVKTAIGVLSWTALSKSRIKSKREQTQRASSYF